MMNRKWSLVLAAAGVCSGIFVIAQPPGGPGGGQPGGRGMGGERRPNPIIEALDSDGDHVLSADEIKAAATALLTLDKNKDGQLTEDELRPAGAPGAGGPGGPGPGGPGAGGRGQGGPGGRRGGPGEGRQQGGPEFGGPGGREGGPGQFRPGQGRPGQGGPGQGGPDGREQGPPPPQGHDPERFVEHALEFDADNDGKLSREELHKFALNMPPPPPQGGPEGGPGGPGSRPNGPRGPGGPGGDRPSRPTRPSSDE